MTGFLRAGHFPTLMAALPERRLLELGNRWSRNWSDAAIPRRASTPIARRCVVQARAPWTRRDR
jgi:hypothetical protein